MPSPSPAAERQRIQHRTLTHLARRTELAERADGRPLTNVCDWLHDTVVTNRREKRKALGEAKHFGCYEEKVPDNERQTATTWVHSRNCPKYDWKKDFDKKVAEQAAVPSAAEKVVDGMFDPATIPLDFDPAETRPIGFVSRDDFAAIDKALKEAVDDAS